MGEVFEFEVLGGWKERLSPRGPKGSVKM